MEDLVSLAQDSFGKSLILLDEEQKSGKVVHHHGWDQDLNNLEVFPGKGLIGSTIMAYGWYHWRAYQRLPLHEALQLGRQQGGQLNRTDLFLKLRLSPEKTDALLEQLVSEGFIERISDNLPPENEVTYRLIS